MVGNHIAQSARGVEVSATLFHAYSFCIGDLHVVNIAAVPDRLKDRVVKTKDQDILHCLFSEVVIDAIDLIFREDCFDLAVQGASRIVVVAKRFLNNHSPPAAILLTGVPDLTQLLDDGRKEFGRSREIEEIVALSIVLLINLAEPSANRGVRCRIAKIAALIVEPLLKPVPGRRAAVLGRKERSDLAAKLFLAQWVNRNSQNREVFWKQRSLPQIEERWNELSLGEITRRAKEHHGTGAGRLVEMWCLLFLISRYRSY